MNISEIEAELFKYADKEFLDFTSSLIPTVGKECFIGVRTPELRSLAKRLVKEDGAEEFIADLPHKYHEENLLHGFIISLEKDFNRAMEKTEDFLPYIDNWAVCDTTSPKVFEKNKAELLKKIKEWVKSDKTYTVRFGIIMLMRHFLDDDFEPWQMEMVYKIRSDEYYVKMMQAWYFATALAKQYEYALDVITEKRLDEQVHNMTIKKAAESRRVSDEHKALLKQHKIK